MRHPTNIQNNVNLNFYIEFKFKLDKKKEEVENKKLIKFIISDIEH